MNRNDKNKLARAAANAQPNDARRYGGGA